ncbi:hypothetical protein Rcae01_00838 [Novipirellula caenicola]|uniref:DUF7691 domain-containing protein n=2 Tax=Novipirellula caenicola TaxID=1536901 RepID=A0ABP9VJL3_9BACT
MGYSHNFFAIDIERLQSVHGSKDHDLLRKVLKDHADDVEDNDAFFEEEIEEGEMPNTATALRQIFEGEIQSNVEGAMYGYALQMIADQMGQLVEGGEYGVGAVRDQPFHSLLLQSGVPISIPLPSDFPEIGFLSRDQISDELQRARNYKHNLGPDSTLTPYQQRMAESEEIIDDVHAYIETLEKAQAIGLGLISFRH